MALYLKYQTCFGVCVFSDASANRMVLVLFVSEHYKSADLKSDEQSSKHVCGGVFILFVHAPVQVQILVICIKHILI